MCCWPMKIRHSQAHLLHRLTDRKSTRLNSSHSQISYAVFCLKKKKLPFRVTGRISQMNVQEGDKVTAGEKLAQLDRVPFATDVAAARADVAQAQAQLDQTQRGYRVEEIAQARATVQQRAADLENARVSLQRQQQLVAAGLVTHQQIDDAQARVRMSEAQLAGARDQLTLELHGSRIEDIQTQKAMLAPAEAPLEKATTALTDTTLLAPSAGIISVRAREAGAIDRKSTRLNSSHRQISYA